jgi:phospholipase/carboxylesterase
MSAIPPEEWNIATLGEAAVRHDSVLSYEFVHARRGMPGPPPLLLMLHGFGSNEADLLGLVPYLDERMHIASLRGPLRIEAGAYGWYRVSHTAGGPVVHEGEERECRKLVARFIDDMIEAHGVDSRRVYLLGFSQGATLALSIALTIPDRIAGALVFCGRVIRELSGSIAEGEQLKDARIFMANGLHDDVVPIGRARSSREFLSGLNVELRYHEYPAAHQISPAMLEHAGEWLKEKLEA